MEKNTSAEENSNDNNSSSEHVASNSNALTNSSNSKLNTHRYYNPNNWLKGSNTLEETEMLMMVAHRIIHYFGAKETINLLINAAEKDRKLKENIEKYLEKVVEDTNNYSYTMQLNNELPEMYHWTQRYKEANKKIRDEAVKKPKSIDGITELLAVHKDFITTAKT